ncbi:MAG TPA: ATP-binding protein [Candidatus Omnitrophota bacterium]|nr:ATP-binding protein [Candidatus Omnitrophota bacterium]
MAICRRVIERLGGRIWVEPNPEGGSRFTFTLPAADQ